MEITTSFVLGILSVVGLLFSVLAIYSFIKIMALNARVENIERDIYARLDELIREVNTYSELDNRRIDGEIARTDSMITEVNRYIDSRVDKMESRLLLVIESAIVSDKTVK